MAATTPSAVFRIYELENLLYAQLENSVELAKKSFDTWQTTHGIYDPYNDNSPRNMQTQSHVDLQEIVPNIPHSGKWGFREVVSIVDAPQLRDTLLHLNKTARCAHTPGVKTKVCIYFLNDGCQKSSEDCEFAHTQAELAPAHEEDWMKYKTALCRDYPRCKRAAKCIFAHGPQQLRQPARTVALGSNKPSLDWSAFELDFCTVYVTSLNHAKVCVPNAATDLLSALKTLLFFRNAMAHMSGHVRGKTGISVTTYNFILHVITVAGRCIAAALDASAVVAFEKRMAEILTDRKPVAPHSALAATAATFSPAAAALTVAPAAESKCKDWSVQEVEALFTRCRFPIQGVVDGQVDGKTLELFCAQEDVQQIFCTSVADGGFGFSNILYVGRFKTEMEALNVSFKTK